MRSLCDSARGLSDHMIRTPAAAPSALEGSEVHPSCLSACLLSAAESIMQAVVLWRLKWRCSKLGSWQRLQWLYERAAGAIRQQSTCRQAVKHS